ncbi:MAG: sugar phosphate isomerase/epimerase [Ruminococcaceae bacterium]|nr:sugar phosphate isomerase/epimerase [Oscillospiraceae bacterium]
MKIGAQLYTVHDYTKTLEDFADALAKVADMGYTSVQVSGTCAYEPEWLAAELKKNGLTCDLTHTDFNVLKADPKKAVENHNIFGCKYIGVGGYGPFYHEGVAGVEKFMAEAPAVAKTIKDMGKKFFYHNHAHEFKPENGTYVFEQLVKNFGADELGFTLDVYWVAEGKHDPCEWLRTLKGRVQCIHFKDMACDSEGKHIFAPVGSGILDFDKIIQASYDAQVEYAFVEQDNCYGEDPFECLKKSYEFLKSKGLN